MWFDFVCGQDTEEAEAEEENKMALRDTWTALVPPKVKVFGWKLFHEILPVKEVLFHRKLVDDPLCFRCGNEAESIVHAIRECDIPREAWRLLEQEANGTSTLAMPLVLAWALWNARNEDLHEGKRQTAKQIVEFAKAFLQTFHNNAVSSGGDGEKVVQQWKPPMNDVIQINFDGALNRRELCGGYGAVARDSNVRTLGCLAGPILHAAEPPIVEATALVRAMEWAQEMGFSSINIEGDDWNLIKRMTGWRKTYPTLDHW